MEKNEEGDFTKEKPKDMNDDQNGFSPECIVDMLNELSYQNIGLQALGKLLATSNFFGLESDDLSAQNVRGGLGILIERHVADQRGIIDKCIDQVSQSDEWRAHLEETKARIVSVT